MWHGTKESKGMDMTIQPGFRRCCRIGPDVTGVAVRQIQGEDVGLVLNAAYSHDRFAEVSLRVAWCMIRRNKHLAMPSTVLPNIVCDNGVATAETMLVTQPFEDTLGGMPLLDRALLILQLNRAGFAGG